METSSKKRSAPNHHGIDGSTKKKKSSTNTNDSPIAGTRITDWDEYEKWKEVRGDIEPTMNYVEITPEAVEEIRKIKNIIGDYVCQLCKVKYENAFALAMHKCPRVVHIEFRCPECDKTFNCPANLASHRRWHKPQPSASTNESTPKTTGIKHPRCSSRSDSRSTNTSSSTVSDTIHEYPFISTISNSDLLKKDSPLSIGAHRKPTSDHVLRAMFNGNSQRILPSTFQSIANSFMMKHSLFYPHSRSLSSDLHRLQSSCIFCHEQFAEVNHLLQHIRRTHSVTSNENNKNTNVTLDKIVF